MDTKINTLDNVEDRIDFNDISLESLGCHLIFGEVNEDSMREAVTFLLKANKLFSPADELTLYINSTGGSVTDGFALIDLMNISKIPVKTVSSGLICSMGVLIAAAGHRGRRVMTRNTQILAHQFSWAFEGKFHELQAASQATKHSAHLFMQHFMRHSTMTEKQIKEIVFGPTDRWLTPAECKKYGLIDHIIDELPGMTTLAPAPAEPPAHGKQSARRARSRT